MCILDTNEMIAFYFGRGGRTRSSSSARSQVSRWSNVFSTCTRTRRWGSSTRCVGHAGGWLVGECHCNLAVACGSLEEDNRPPTPLPLPPAPSFWHHDTGAYAGVWTDDGGGEVNIVVPARRPSSTTTSITRPQVSRGAIQDQVRLTFPRAAGRQRLGYPPATAIAARFRDDAIAGLNQG